MITQLAELPLPLREPADLLALDRDRIAPDGDYAGFGWCRLDAVVLAGVDRPPRTVAPALVVALHAADAQPDRDDIELLFELPEQSVCAPLSAVLPLLLARLPAAADVVLALCNPGQVRIVAPAGAPRLHYGLGDVTSWLDHEPDGPRVRLSARRWETATGAP